MTAASPIFDSVVADQGVEQMPLPPFETYEQFRERVGFPAFLNRAELILRGEFAPGDRNSRGQFVKKATAKVPVKKQAQ